jgi:hypothetical protein
MTCSHTQPERKPMTLKSVLLTVVAIIDVAMWLVPRRR